MNKDLVKESRVNFMELAHKDYNEHVKPIQDEIKRTEKVIRELHDEAGKAVTDSQRKKIGEVLRELYAALPKMQLECDKMSNKYRVDLNLFELARELDGLEVHNATAVAYMEAEKRIKEKLLPIANKLQHMYENPSSTPSLVYKIGSALNESRRLKMKDRAELEQKFYDRYKKLETEKQETYEIDTKYGTLLDEVLKKYIQAE